MLSKNEIKNLQNIIKNHVIESNAQGFKKYLKILPKEVFEKDITLYRGLVLRLDDIEKYKYSKWLYIRKLITNHNSNTKNELFCWSSNEEVANNFADGPNSEITIDSYIKVVIKIQSKKALSIEKLNDWINIQLGTDYKLSFNDNEFINEQEKYSIIKNNVVFNHSPIEKGKRSSYLEYLYCEGLLNDNAREVFIYDNEELCKIVYKNDKTSAYVRKNKGVYEIITKEIFPSYTLITKILDGNLFSKAYEYSPESDKYENLRILNTYHIDGTIATSSVLRKTKENKYKLSRMEFNSSDNTNITIIWDYDSKTQFTIEKDKIVSKEKIYGERTDNFAYNDMEDFEQWFGENLNYTLGEYRCRNYIYGIDETWIITK